MTTQTGPVFVVFSDAFNRTLRDEDLICHSKEEAKRHSKDLTEMGHEPVTKQFASEEAFYAWKDKA